MKEKGLFYSIKIKGRKEKEFGILLDESEQWIYISSLYSDYMIDGYKVINKKYVISMERSDGDVFTEKVLRANNRIISDFPKIPLETNMLFSYLEKNQVAFDISTDKEDSIFVGKVQKRLEKSFYLKPLGTKGEWMNELYLFRMGTIRIISFDTDYIKSLLAFNEKSHNELSGQ